MLGDAQDTVYGSHYTMPTEYEITFGEIAPNLPQLVNSTAAATGESWDTVMQRWLPTLIATWQQKEMIEINLQRARNNQPPLSIGDYAGLGVNVGVNAGTRNMIYILGAMAVGAVILGPMLRGR